MTEFIVMQPTNKYTKDYDKNKELSYLKYWDVNNLYGWAMLQKLPVKMLSGLNVIFNLMMFK